MSDFDFAYKPQRKPAVPASSAGTVLPRRKPEAQAVADAGANGAAGASDKASGGASAAGADGADTFVLASTVPRKPAVPTSARARAPTIGDFAENARSAARIANVSFTDVLAKAAQESNFNVNARSGSSSAAGPFQFIEQTWLDMLKRHGAAYGLGKEAAQIRMHNGVASVADPALRKRLLELRKDVALSSGMAARYLDESSRDLAQALKRKPSETESRMAYFLGPGGAAKLIKATQRNPDGLSDAVLPQAAAANRSFFYGAGGGALTNREAMARITNFVNKHTKEFASLGQEDRPMSSDRMIKANPNVG